MTTDKFRMDTAQTEFLRQMAEIMANGEGHDLSDEVVSNTFNSAQAALTESLMATLSSQEGRSLLKTRRRAELGFVRRNVVRWQVGLDKLEQLIAISEETGSIIADALGDAALEENDALYEAVVSNHARAVLVAKEILWLMQGGFPDGALARWRTLHEIAVTSKFISEHGRVVAERYLSHDHIMSHRRARSYMEHHQRAKLEPIDDDTLTLLADMEKGVIANYGEAMKQDYGWAAEALGKARATFADIEAATRLDHWRPRYKWATNNTHGAYRGPDDGLGVSEALERVRLVGRSNSGMTDPGHMTAISLNLATLPIVVLEANLDRISVYKAMLQLSDEIGDGFWQTQQQINR